MRRGTPNSGELSKGVGGTFGRFILFHTATSQVWVCVGGGGGEVPFCG